METQLLDNNFKNF